jgi:hypothetical protein|nr:MAG TPA: hypothetical protein [Caudoviricetes sp.]
MKLRETIWELKRMRAGLPSGSPGAMALSRAIAIVKKENERHEAAVKNFHGRLHGRKKPS